MAALKTNQLQTPKQKVSVGKWKLDSEGSGRPEEFHSGGVSTAAETHLGVLVARACCFSLSPTAKMNMQACSRCGYGVYPAEKVSCIDQVSGKECDKLGAFYHI